MIPSHAFVDETKAQGVVLTAVTMLPCNLAAARKVVRGFVMPGQRRIHFVSESDARRKQILDGIAELGPDAVIYDAAAFPRRQQREACLRAHEEPLLAIPDAVAWCWQRGGPWRERVREMVRDVQVL